MLLLIDELQARFTTSHYNPQAAPMLEVALLTSH